MSSVTNPVSAFLFPGQGAQTVGMCSRLYRDNARARSIFDEADTILGFSLTEMILKGPAEELRQTINAQPAILCASIACLSAMEEKLGDSMPCPAFVAGHSLGEYTAAVASKALSFADGLQLVRKRGELMQTAGEMTPSGMIAVIGISLEGIREICDSTGVQLANLNSPGQFVIAGPLPALDEAVGIAEVRGARRIIRLDVSGGFHSEVMRPAQEGLHEALMLVDFRQPRTPVIGNTTGRPTMTADEIREELAQQLCSCVMWQASVQYMVASGVTRFVEIGPGNVLTGLVKRITPEVETITVGDLDAVEILKVS